MKPVSWIQKHKIETHVQNQVPPLWNLGITLHEPRVNILKVIDPPAFLHAPQQRLEAHLDVVPVIQSRIRNNGTVDSKEINTTPSQFKVPQKHQKN
jgi:hypothetical protein